MTRLNDPLHNTPVLTSLGDHVYWIYENIEDPNDRDYDAIRRAFLNVIIARSELMPDSIEAIGGK